VLAVKRFFRSVIAGVCLLPLLLPLFMTVSSAESYAAPLVFIDGFNYGRNWDGSVNVESSGIDNFGRSWFYNPRPFVPFQTSYNKMKIPSPVTLPDTGVWVEGTIVIERASAAYAPDNGYVSGYFAMVGPGVDIGYKFPLTYGNSLQYYWYNDPAAFPENEVAYNFRIYLPTNGEKVTGLNLGIQSQQFSAYLFVYYTGVVIYPATDGDFNAYTASMPDSSNFEQGKEDMQGTADAMAGFDAMIPADAGDAVANVQDNALLLIADPAFLENAVFVQRVINALIEHTYLSYLVPILVALMVFAMIFGFGLRSANTAVRREMDFKLKSSGSKGKDDG
jgi:hypothetical protein